MQATANKHQQGFSAIAAVVLVLVVVGICLVGWYVLAHDKQPAASNNSTITQQQPNDTPQQQTKADPSEGGKYLVIKEWGVRFELPQDLRGDIYYVSDQYSAATMVIDSKHLPQGAQCVSFGLTRTEEPIKNPTDPNGFDTSSFEQINGFHYSPRIGVIACSDKDEVHVEAAAIQRKLYDAVQSLETLPQ